MKKLNKKVFLTVFFILSLLAFVMVFTSITRTYLEKKNSITDILTSSFKKMDIKNVNKESNRPIPNTPDIKKIYLDFTIYTIILDDNLNYRELINNTNDDNLDESSIKDIANNIISNHKDNFYVGNLYIDKYAYIFTPGNTLIIMDNTKTNDFLIKQLLINILIFILGEALIIVITSFITKWIITPVKKSFEKQKTFVADASHELKTPLAVIMASCDAYLNDKDDKWVNNIKNESIRMNKLVTELLDLAKSEKEVELEYNNLSNIIESSILTFEGLFYDNKIKLKYNIDNDIYLNCNEDLIIELMSILIDNAIKHVNEKGKVEVNLNKVNKQVILEVKNTGSYINKEDEEKIFERFYKVDSSRNRNTNNYGLGLSIAKNIVNLHSGKICAYSKDKYTTFKITWNQK